jgi:2-dehydro-3-deoxy-D-arabinonate dehydratase
MKLFKTLYKKKKYLVLEKESSEKYLLPPEVTISKILEEKNPSAFIKNLSLSPLKDEFEILPPVDDQDLWACGVTYFNSRLARNEESKAGHSYYDLVYSAERPQIFYKGRGRDIADGKFNVSMRPDSAWTVPEPELVLVINKFGKVIGFTAGNDMSCRDIEGINPLYQPQAKVWMGGCSIGPCILLADSESQPSFEISMKIFRNGDSVFEGHTDSTKIVRKFSDLADTLFKYRQFRDGAFLFTGTGIVPEGKFTLDLGDKVEVRIPQIGTLTNEVIGNEY